MYAQRHVEIMLCGNKVDLADDRAIEYSAAKAYAEKNNFQYFETSAKTKTNVDKAFTKLTQTVYTIIPAATRLARWTPRTRGQARRS